MDNLNNNELNKVVKTIYNDFADRFAIDEYFIDGNKLILIRKEKNNNKNYDATPHHYFSGLEIPTIERVLAVYQDANKKPDIAVYISSAEIKDNQIIFYLKNVYAAGGKTETITKESLEKLAKMSGDFYSFIREIRSFNVLNPELRGYDITAPEIKKILHLGNDREKNTNILKRFYKEANTVILEARTIVSIKIDDIIGEKMSKLDNIEKTLLTYLIANMRIGFMPDDSNGAVELEHHKLSAWNLFVWPNFKYATTRERIKMQKIVGDEVREIIEFYITEQLDSDLAKLKSQTESANAPDVLKTNKTDTMNNTPKDLQELNAHISKPEVTANATPVDLAYIPASVECPALDTTAPESLRYEMMKAIKKIDADVNGVDDYVSRKLGYAPGKCTPEQSEEGVKCLCTAFGAEQVDAVAVCIYNIENRHESTIIGDMTGIGKGRVAAAVLEYAKTAGLIPIFFTEKPNLFTDIMRDLIHIGSDAAVPKEFLLKDKEWQKKSVTKKAIKEAREAAEEVGEDPFEAEEQLWNDAEDGGIWVDKYQKNEKYESDIIGKKRFVPFIVNDPEPKTAIKDSNGNLLYQSTAGAAKKATHGVLPAGYDGIFITYSQIAGSKASLKRDFIKSLIPNAVIVLDESHNASGQSNTKKFLKECLLLSKGAVFLSATYAKRPENMSIYAAKTVIREADLDDSQLEAAIKKGGVALQEVISAQLTREGEHIRREKSYEGIEVNYMNLDESQLMEKVPHPEYNLKYVHTALSDSTTQLLRDIMDFQRDYVKPVIADLDKGYKSNLEKGTEEGGITNPPIFNGVFQLITQMLFSIKAEVVAKHAVERLKEGKKPIIAFSNTMESFLNTMRNSDGDLLSDGEQIEDDFAVVFQRRLQNCMKFTTTTPKGDVIHRNLLEIQDDLPPTFMPAYRNLLKKVKDAKLGLSLSPIDVLYYHIQNEGFTVNEVTGRNRRLKINGDGTAIYTNREKPNPTDVFRMYNDNEIDCLLINKAGATGVSAHALNTSKVPKDKVKQRVMIILQAELDVNQEVQKRGRINRTGQLLKPIYDYMISSVPAEQRYMMMLQKKLKSLDANTSAKQDQSSALLHVDDFLNKYGDKYVTEWMCYHISFHNKIGGPLGDLEQQVQKYKGEANVPAIVDAANKCASKVAVLSCAEQSMFYDEILNIYNGKIEELIQSHDFDLYVQDLKLEAETESRSIVAVGNDKGSVFSRHSILEKCIVNNLSKPYTAEQVRAMINQTLTNADGEQIDSAAYASQLKAEIEANSNMLIERYETEIRNEMQKKLEVFKSSPSLISAKSGKKNVKPRGQRIIDETRDIFGSEVNPALLPMLARMDKEEPGTSEAAVEEPTLTPEEIESILAEKEKELTDTMEDRIAEMIAVEKKDAAIKKGAIDFFRVGRVIRFPKFENIDTKKAASEIPYSKGIFLGFNINRNIKNPYIKSNIKLRFALASTMKYRAISLTSGDVILACRDMSMLVPSVENAEYVLNRWNAEVKEASDNRVERYIVTGNVLRVMANDTFENGKLVSYTTINGGVKKGLMLPVGFRPEGRKSLHGEGEKAVRITVPLLSVLPMFLQSDANQNPVRTNLGIIIEKKNYQSKFYSAQKENEFEYELLMAGTADMKKYFAEDRVLVDLMRNGFNSFKPNMVGKMAEGNIEELLNHLVATYKATASLSQAQFDTYILPTLTLTDYSDEEEKLPPSVVAADKESEKPGSDKTTETPPVDLDKEKAEADALLVLQKQAELTAARNEIDKLLIRLVTTLEVELGI